MSKSIEEIGSKIYERLVYPIWIRNNEPTEKMLADQKNKHFSCESLISIVCPLYHTPHTYLHEMIKSVLAQTYSNFQLCLVDAGSEADGLEDLVKQYNEKRIIYKKLDRNSGISENTNHAIEIATGEYIAFLDHDDVLAPFALYEVVQAINKNIDVDFIYSDEDQFTTSMTTRRNPFFKPDFSPDYLYGLNYICHFTVVKRSLLNQAGFLNSDFDGSQDYDFDLRATKLAQKIVHIPKILYHWRVHKGSVASGASAKNYAQDAGAKALKNFFSLQRKNVDIQEYRIKGRYQPVYPSYNTPISVVLYNGNDKDCLKCIRSLETGTYQSYAVHIVGKPLSLEQYIESEGLSVYEALQKGAKYASGDYVLFLHSDFYVEGPDFLKRMFSYAQQSHIGAVGCKLVHKKNNRILALGIAAGVGFLFKGQNSRSRLYFDKGFLPHNVSGVPYYGMLTSKELFEKTGGFTANQFTGHGVELDYCIRLKQIGYYSVVVPQCELHSESNHANDTFKDVVMKYPQEFRQGDPYYNPNFSFKSGGFYIDGRKKQNSPQD